MTLRYLYLAICGIFLAGIIHISIILLIPDYGSRDAWNIISAKNDLWSFRQFGDGENVKTAFEDIDPFIRLGACTFDLDQSGLHFRGGQSKKFWSLSVFDQDGKVIYSLNNRTAIDNTLDLVVLNPVQMIGLRESPPEEIERSVIVETDISKGFVVLRQFHPDIVAKSTDDHFMKQVVCTKYQS